MADGSMGDGVDPDKIVSYDDIDWVVPDGVEPGPDGSALRRKRLIQDVDGFYNQVVSCPPGWVIAPHHHNHAELFVVLSGSCDVDDVELRPFDSAVLAANQDYGVRAGVEGLEFMVIRTGAVTTDVNGT